MEGGELMIHHEGRFTAECAGFKGTFRLVAEKDTRSLQQNALLWVWNTIVGNDLGWEPEEVHEFTKSKVHLVHKTWTDKITGEIVDEAFPGDTHTLAKDAMSEYMEKFQRFWAEQGIVLPSSEEEYGNHR